MNAHPGTSADVAHVHKDYTGSKMGMWLFLFTELLLFGALFIVYAVYRAMHPEEFHEAGKELNVFFGTINTIILLTSSLTMALSIAAAHRGSMKVCVMNLILTIGFAAWFMVNKWFEWSAKIDHGLYPNSEVLLQHADGEILFFGLYYSMTGLHGVHVIIGAIVLIVVGFKLRNKPAPEIGPDGEKIVKKENFASLEYAGLYWHLVDLIWIFLFPLFYLIT